MNALEINVNEVRIAHVIVYEGIDIVVGVTTLNKKIINSHRSKWVDKKSMTEVDLDIVKMVDANTPAEEESFLLYKLCDYNNGINSYYVVNHKPYHVAGDYFQHITYKDQLDADNDLDALREFTEFIAEYYR